MSPLFSLNLQLLPVTPCEMKLLAVLLLLWIILFFCFGKKQEVQDTRNCCPFLERQQLLSETGRTKSTELNSRKLVCLLWRILSLARKYPVMITPAPVWASEYRASLGEKAVLVNAAFAESSYGIFAETLKILVLPLPPPKSDRDQWSLKDLMQ